MALPEEIMEKVCRRVFTDMEALGWRGLTDEEKTRQYNTWVDDPEVGGVLAQFNDDPRHWIKDGPVKEWPRALMGVGSYAKYLPVQGGRIQEVVRLALGDDWVADTETVEIKPMRVVAHHRTDVDELVVVAWAPSKDFKHLLWAALDQEARGDHRPWVLVVRDTFEKPASSNVRVHHERIARRCGLRVEHIQVT